MNLTPSEIGLITEMKCQTYLLERGYNILVPIGNHQKYDLVIEHHGKFSRIQCKHAQETCENSFSVNTKYQTRATTTHFAYTEKDCDAFMTEFNGVFYIFPVFGTKNTRFWLIPKSRKDSKNAEDYLAEKFLDNLQFI